MKTKLKCQACGVAYDKHDGLVPTCRKLERARSALRVIHTWATFQGGTDFNRKDTEKLCRKALKESE